MTGFATTPPAYLAARRNERTNLTALRDRDVAIAIGCILDGEKDQAHKVMWLSFAEQVLTLLGPDVAGCVMATDRRAA